MKEKSKHRQLVEYFYEVSKSARGFKPIVTAKDAGQLKRILELEILSVNEIEMLMLYFLADVSYRNLGPSIATMMSSTVLNSLINKLRNRAKFYRELEGYMRHLPKKQGFKVSKDIDKKINDLISKLTINKK